MKRVIRSSKVTAALGSDTPDAVESATNTDTLKNDITEVVDKVMCDEFGFPEKEASDYYVVEVEPSSEVNNYTKVEVRAELNYDDLMILCENLDKYVEKLDKNAYFEPVTSGIIECYLESTLTINSSTDISAPRDRYISR